jgi:hypothetical protein
LLDIVSEVILAQADVGSQVTMLQHGNISSSAETHIRMISTYLPFSTRNNGKILASQMQSSIIRPSNCALIKTQETGAKLDFE